MNRFFSRIIYLLLFLLTPCLLPGALEIELTAGLNNMAFNPDRVTAHGEDADSGEFEGFQFIYGDLRLTGDISDKMGFKVHAARDNILQNSLSGKVTANTGNINVEFGSFIGISDDLEKPDAGITGGIELLYPGIVSLSLNGSSSLGVQNEFMSNNSRETAEIKLGFWLPHLIPVISAGTKSFTRQPEDSAVIRDELIRLQFSVDIFAKNIPVTVRIDAGYEIFTRSYKNGNSGTDDKLTAIFAGFETKWQITKPLRIIAGFEMPVYCKAEEPMKDPESIFSLYKFHGGIAYTFFPLPTVYPPK